MRLDEGECGRWAMHRPVQNVLFVIFSTRVKLTTRQSSRVLQKELDKLIQLSEEWIGRKVADHAYEKTRITDIFERINEARVQFEVCITNSYSYVSFQFPLLFSWRSVSESLRPCMKWTKPSKCVTSPFSNPVPVSLFQQQLFLEHLEPSKIAHHDYLLEGTDSGLLHREICTAGTCVCILDGITMSGTYNLYDKH